MADQQIANQWLQVKNEATQELDQVQTEIARLQPIVEQQRLAGRINLGDYRDLETLRRREFDLQGVITNADTQYELTVDAPYGTRANPETRTTTAPVDPENDPFEAQRQEAETRLTTEQPVTEAEIRDSLRDDPEYLSALLRAEIENAETNNASPGTNQISTADPNRSVNTGANQARTGGNSQAFVPFPEAPDYRVRIALAPSANYLYKDPNITRNDLLYPLVSTNGVIFPYLPNISLTYAASYSATDLVHSNYKIYNYNGSSIDGISITGDFTAQDVNEANYILAVMHFFKSVTKMFYGQDQDPIRGVPPPLVYLSGHGEYGFDNHPMVVNSYTLNYPTDVDYINAGPTYNTNATFNSYPLPNLAVNNSSRRLFGSRLQPGGIYPPPTFGVTNNSRSGITRVPTKLQVILNCHPIVTRKNISNTFSLKEYATGKLLKGSQRSGGGIW